MEPLDPGHFATALEALCKAWSQLNEVAGGHVAAGGSGHRLRDHDLDASPASGKLAAVCPRQLLPGRQP